MTAELLFVSSGFLLIINVTQFFYMFQNHKRGHMFSFITGKVLGVFMNFFCALYTQQFHEYNGAIFVMKI